MSEELDYVQAGDRIGPYRVVHGFKRGRGGMARVFEVEVHEKYRQPNMPRRLALKVAKEEYQFALAAEADFLSRFDHPNVVRIYPIAGYHRPVYAARARFRFGWGWYYTMELISGGSLERILTRPTTITDLLRPPPEGERRLGLLEALGIARQLAAALEHVHERCVVNLDVKPGNVLFRRRRFRYLRDSVPRAVLCDFGISRDLRHPRVGQLGIATPEYVSPEQALEMSRHSRLVDVRSDIFSLGVVLYEMLTGSLPFENIALVADPSYVPLPPRQLRPAIPSALEAIVMRALAKDPAHRFQTASEMRAALDMLPTPFDWGATARRTFAGIALATCLAGSGLVGYRAFKDHAAPTPTLVSPVPTAVIETPTPHTPATATPRHTIASPTAVAPTVTLRPTLTPSPRPRPTEIPIVTVTPGGY